MPAMPSAIELTGRVRPLEGQLSILPDVPPVKYCQRCRRMLRGERSIERGLGPTCWKRTKTDESQETSE